MHKRMSGIALLLIIMVVTGALAGCGYTPKNFWNGLPLQYGAEGSDTSLLVILQGDLFGYAETTGNIAIKPQFSEARPFYEGIAAVKNSKKWGYIDKTGKAVLPFQYNEALDFHNGKAIIGAEYVQYTEIEFQKCCIIDIKGNILKEMDCYEVGNYSDGMTFFASKTETFFLDNNYTESMGTKYSFQGVSDFF